MTRSIGKRAVCVFVFFFVVSTIAVPAAMACQALAICPGGSFVWCQTFGNCGESAPTCMAWDGWGVYCNCNGAELLESCTPESY